MKIDTKFPGGKGVVESMEGDKVWMRPHLRDTEGDWFWWYFRVRGAAGRRACARGGVGVSGFTC